MFVRQHVVPRGRKNQKDKNGNPIPYGKESVDAYVKAVVNLYNIQVSIGNNSHPHPRNKVLRDFLNTLSIKEVKRKRDQYEDRGAHTLTDGYNLREHQSICFRLLSNSFLDCRTRVDWLVGHSTISRGESKRMIQLPDLFMLELEREGPSLCNALVITMNHGKMNQHGKIEYGSFIRHVDVNVCPFGAVALYFFTRFHLEKEAFPDFTTREAWYDIHLLKGKDRKTRMSYDTQNRHFKAVLGEELVEATKTTHINRLSSVRWMDEEDVSNDQQRRAGRWNCDRMVGSYLNTLPKQSMRALAGFYSKTAGNFYLARATIEPPEELQKLIFPEIEYWLGAFAQKKVQKDIAGPNFLNLLKYLRVVLLQVNNDVYDIFIFNFN